jgi:ribonuclease HII
VAGIVVPIEHPDLELLFKKGLVNDSKKLSDGKRRKVLNLLVDSVLFGKISIIDVNTIVKLKPKEAWRYGIADVIEQVRLGLGLETLWQNVDIVVDGPVDKKLHAAYPWIRFIPKADSSVPAVAAASIFAKTARNDLMIEMGKRYPEFRFKKHFGYGTKLHQSELRKHGKTAVHRPIRSMDKYATKNYVPST